MHPILVQWLIMLCQCTVTASSAADQYSPASGDIYASSLCSENFFTMEQSLLQNTDNRFNLLMAFYPPREAYPVVVRVNYTFTLAFTGLQQYDDMTTNESQIWYWTESEFYLIQPLEVFQFTSLLFGNMPYRKRHLSIVLESECISASTDYFMLLTTKLQLYAQSATTGPTSPTQPVSSSYTAVAVSLTEMQKDTLQSTFAKVWLHLILIVFPILSWLLLYLCDPVQLLLGDKTWTKLEDEHTHGTLAAMIQISVVFTTYVLILDVCGVYYTINIIGDNMYGLSSPTAAFYLSTVTGLLVDVAAFLWVWTVVVTIFLQTSFKKLKRQVTADSTRVKMMFSTVTIAPILCLTNHIHYIVIAFISDPFHAGSTAIVYTISFFLFFVIFRQFYNRLVLHSNKRPKIVSRMELCPKCSAKEKLWNPLSRTPSYSILTDEHRNIPEVKCNCFIPGPNCHAPFNTHMVVLGIVVVSPLVILYEAVIITLFLSLPLTKSLESGPSRLYTLYQGTGLLVVALLTYNIILNPTPFSIAKTIERLAKRLRLPENINFWNRLSIEEKLAKVLVTLLETHFQNTTPTDAVKKKHQPQERKSAEMEPPDKDQQMFVETEI